MTISGTPSAAGSFTFTITATDSASPSHSGFQQYTVSVALGLSPSTLANGTYNTSYSQTITATGGNGSYTFSKTSGTLPSGLTLSSGGVLSGTPTAAGSYTFTVGVTDTAGTLRVPVLHGDDRPAASPTTLANGTYNTSYSQTLTAAGGNGTYTFAKTSGTLPSGLTLSRAQACSRARRRRPVPTASRSRPPTPPVTRGRRPIRSRSGWPSAPPP